MKYFLTFSLLIFSFLLLGCASSTSSETSSDSAPETGTSDSATGARTAYEGQTGSRLLMERYQTGEIQGLRD